MEKSVGNREEPRQLHEHILLPHRRLPRYRGHGWDASVTSEGGTKRQNERESATVRAGGYTLFIPHPVHDCSTKPPPGSIGRPATTSTAKIEPDSGGLSASRGTFGAGLEGSRCESGKRHRTALEHDEPAERPLRDGCASRRSFSLIFGNDRAAVSSVCRGVSSNVCRTSTNTAMPPLKRSSNGGNTAQRCERGDSNPHGA